MFRLFNIFSILKHKYSKIIVLKHEKTETRKNTIPLLSEYNYKKILLLTFEGVLLLLYCIVS